MSIKHTTKRLLVVSVLLHMMLFHNLYAQTAPSANESAHFEELHCAERQGDAEAGMEFIKNGANLEQRDGLGRTPLIIADFASHEPVVKLLARAGADMNAMEHRAYDAATIAVANDVEMYELTILLAESAGNITSLCDGTDLIAATDLSHHKVVDRLIKAGAPLDHFNNLNWTALFEAVVLGDGGPDHTETVELLLNAGADRSIVDG